LVVFCVPVRTRLSSDQATPTPSGYGLFDKQLIPVTRMAHLKRLIRPI
jgi:hypothetical protein